MVANIKTFATWQVILVKKTSFYVYLQIVTDIFLDKAPTEVWEGGHLSSGDIQTQRQFPILTITSNQIELECLIQSFNDFFHTIGLKLIFKRLPIFY